MLVYFFSCFCFGGFYFSNTTIYDGSLNALREGVYFFVNESGLVRLKSSLPLIPGEDMTVVDGALVLPRLVDFYSLVQDRGLGMDRDLDAETQGRIARYLRHMGMGVMRDPVFPVDELTDSLKTDITLLAQRGYLDVAGGAGSRFCLLVNPMAPLEEAVTNLPQRGPITLWWSAAGGDGPVLWPESPDFLHDLIREVHGQHRRIGCYIQDIAASDLEPLAAFDFDFYEGLPAEPFDVDLVPESLVWVPLAALNDKRYCAWQLEKRLGRAVALGLFKKDTLTQLADRLEQIPYRIRDRCLIWKKRREPLMATITRWLEKGRPFALGSAGGHLFSFSGDIRAELDLLDDLGATQPQLLKAAFVTSPALLGETPPYLEIGRPANFLVYKKPKFWLRLIGTKVDLHFIDGKPSVAELKLPH